MAGGFKGEEPKGIYNPEQTVEKKISDFLDRLDKGEKVAKFSVEIDEKNIDRMKQFILARGYAVATDNEGGKYFLDKSDAQWGPTFYVKPGAKIEYEPSPDVIKNGKSWQSRAEAEGKRVLRSPLSGGSYYFTVDSEYVSKFDSADEDLPKYEELISKIVKNSHELAGQTVWGGGGRTIRLNGNILEFDSSPNPSNGFARQVMEEAAGINMAAEGYSWQSSKSQIAGSVDLKEVVWQKGAAE